MKNNYVVQTCHLSDIDDSFNLHGLPDTDQYEEENVIKWFQSIFFKDVGRNCTLLNWEKLYDYDWSDTIHDNSKILSTVKYYGEIYSLVRYRLGGDDPQDFWVVEKPAKKSQLFVDAIEKQDRFRRGDGLIELAEWLFGEHED
jgi:hypothetical protein